jgi:hypothetical protein
MLCDAVGCVESDGSSRNRGYVEILLGRPEGTRLHAREELMAARYIRPVILAPFL